MVDLAINCMSDTGGIEVEICFIVKGAATVATAFLENHTFQPHDSQYLWGSTNFVERSTLLSNLDGGSLAIVVHMRKGEVAHSPSKPFVPENPLNATAMANNQTKSCIIKSDADVFVVSYGGFAGLPTQKRNNNFVYSPAFTSFGHSWGLCLFPGGHVGSDDGMVDVVINYMSDTGSIEVEISFFIKRVATAFLENHTFEPHGSQYLWGTTNFVERSKLLSNLDGGSLVIEVHMRKVKPANVSLPFVPPGPFEVKYKLKQGALEHASQCTSSKCTSSNCQRMKSYLKHGSTCKVNST